MCANIQTCNRAVGSRCTLKGSQVCLKSLKMLRFCVLNASNDRFIIYKHPLFQMFPGLKSGRTREKLFDLTLPQRCLFKSIPMSCIYSYLSVLGREVAAHKLD